MVGGLRAGASVTATLQGVTGPTPPEVSVPPLLINAVVTSLQKVPDGDLIELVEAPWRALVDLLIADPTARFQIPHRKLEEIVAASYRDAGFDDVILTDQSGDHGRDVIATRRGYYSIRIVDQVKAFRADRAVTANDVRALVGVVAADLQVSKGLVTTTSDFAPGIAHEYKHMIPHRLELVNGPTFLARLAHFRKK